MFESILNTDQYLFFVINGSNSGFWDSAMWLISGKYLWLLLYVVLLYLLYKNYPKKYWILLLVIAFLIALNDQTCNLFKYNVGRFRPSHDPAIQYMVHIVNNYRGGTFGFYSGHAANTAAVAFLIISLLGAKYRWLIPVMLGYTLLSGYSRIYLGVHFPLDVMTGFTIGGITGFFAGNLYKRFYFKKMKAETI
jgi:undecaprenyl-diphosphatase